MNNSIEQLLANCLEAIERDELTIEECLAQHPAHRAELAELLQTVLTIKNTPAVMPRAQFRQAARGRLLARLPDYPSVTFGERIRLLWQTRKSKLTRRFAMSWILIGTMLASLVGGGAAYASSEALPGEVLYPAKIAIEDLRLILADDQSDVELYMQFAEERLDEIAALVEAGNYDKIPVAAAGYEQRMDGLAQLGAESGPLGETFGETVAIQLQDRLQTHTQVLTQLQNQLRTATQSQAKESLQLAIQASTVLAKMGPPEDAGPPADAGPGENAGPSESAGPPENSNAPEGAGPGEDAGPPDDAGPPEDAGPPNTGGQQGGTPTYMGGGQPDEMGSQGQGQGQSQGGGQGGRP